MFHEQKLEGIDLVVCGWEVLWVFFVSLFVFDLFSKFPHHLYDRIDEKELG